MGNSQKLFGNVRKANNTGSKTAQRITNLRTSFAAADEAKKKFIEDSEKALKKSESILKLDAGDRKELFISFNKLRAGVLTSPDNEKVKNIYKFIIPLYLYFLEYIPSKLGFHGDKAKEAKDLTSMLKTFLKNIETGVTSGGGDDSEYDDTSKDASLLRSLSDGVRQMGAWQMFSYSTGSLGGGSACSDGPICLFIYFLMFAMVCIMVGIGLAALAGNLIGTVSTVLYKHYTGSKNSKKIALQIVHDNPLLKMQPVKPSKWIKVNEGGEEFYENLDTRELSWVLPEGATLVKPQVPKLRNF